MTELRTELPPMPDEMKRLPLERGYPVPWFVAKIDDHYDFRVVASGAVARALTFELCWVCGAHLGPWVTFVAGPMCAINRNSAEPPCHRQCAEWSAQACPFMCRPHMDRREGGLPEGAAEPDGLMLRRNPGVAMCWHTTRGSFKKRRGHMLFDIGTPYEVTWWAEGRPATRDEVVASIDSGYPLLEELAEKEGPAAVARLAKARRRAMQHIPAIPAV